MKCQQNLPSMSEKKIKLVEALEIYWHSPPYNGEHISSCPKPLQAPLLQIVNKGKRGKLLECIHNNPPPWY